MGKRISNLALLALLLTIVSLAVVNGSIVACGTCSNEENVVWATDGRTCKVFRNLCLLLAENCGRAVNSQTLLEEIKKEKCQKMCSRICPAIYAPVCGEYNGERLTFSNLCMMTSHICRTGKTYSLFSEDSCSPIISNNDVDNN